MFILIILCLIDHYVRKLFIVLFFVMVKRARETENSPQTPCNDWHVIEHNVAHLLHWDREGDSYGETGEQERQRTPHRLPAMILTGMSLNTKLLTFLTGTGKGIVTRRLGCC